jgi:tight adherence protein C
MNITLFLIAGAVFVAVLGALFLLWERPGPRRDRAVRLENYINLATAQEVEIETLSTRGQHQASTLERLFAAAAVTAPRKLRANTVADLARARVSMQPNVFLGIRGVLLGGSVVASGLWLLSSPQRSIVQWGICGVALLLVPRLPGMWLKRRIKKNKRAIEHALPYALDLMVACLEGGLSLEATLDKVASESDSMLSEEIRRTLAEIALGRPSTEALRDLGDRTGAPDLKRLTETVAQSERMGVSIAEAMRTMSEESRTRRRQHAEEQARKAPVKMLPVLVMCTLPAVGAILMTPTIITMGRLVATFARH